MASLQELPDDELDKLFRSSAGEFEPPYNPEDWNSLRRRLDENDRSRFLDRFIYWGLPLLLLLLTTVSLIVPPGDGPSAIRVVAKNLKTVADRQVPGSALSGKNAPGGSVAEKTGRSGDASLPAPVPAGTDAPAVSEVKSENRVSEKPAEKTAFVPSKTGSAETARSAEPAPAKKPGEDVKNNAPESVAQTVSIRSATENRLAKTARRKNGPASRRTASARFDELPSGDVPRPRVAGNDNDARADGLVQTRKNRPKPASENRAKAGEGSLALSEKPAPETPVSETGPVALSGNLAYIPARPPAKPVLPSLPEPDLEPMRPPVVPKTMPPIPVIGYPALSVRFVAAPDLNFVGKSPKAARDFETGVLVEYRFLRRWTVQSGVLRSVKKYTAPASEYTLPDTIAKHWYGPWYESVGAVCTVLDIPLNVRYDVLLNDRRRWFVSAGASSYIMQKETYEYYYPPGTKPTSTNQKYKGWNGTTGLHAFSHWNFSVGYERNFRAEGPFRRFSWQVEPFLKYARGATLGFGKIRLTSTGVFFSVRYRL
ncbi:hypothetical protein GCM10027299_16180 [Larkinella ripae]